MKRTDRSIKQIFLFIIIWSTSKPVLKRDMKMLFLIRTKNRVSLKSNNFEGRFFATLTNNNP